MRRTEVMACCMKCRSWHLDPNRDALEPRYCSNPRTQMRRPVEPYEKCQLYKKRKAQPPTKGSRFEYEVDHKEQAIRITVGFEKHYGLNRAGKSFVYARRVQSIRMGLEDWTLAISLTRRLTEEERLEKALMGKAFAPVPRKRAEMLTI